MAGLSNSDGALWGVWGEAGGKRGCPQIAFEIFSPE